MSAVGSLRYLDLPDALFFAFCAGADRERRRSYMADARSARANRLGSEAVCAYVGAARRWHWSYLDNLAKAMEAQP